MESTCRARCIYGGVISEEVLVLTPRGAKRARQVVITAIRPNASFDDALSLVDGREFAKQAR
jgi:hypothetical protein